MVCLAWFSPGRLYGNLALSWTKLNCERVPFTSTRINKFTVTFIRKNTVRSVHVCPKRLQTSEWVFSVGLLGSWMSLFCPNRPSSGRHSELESIVYFRWEEWIKNKRRWNNGSEGFLEMLVAMLCALSSGPEHGNESGGEGQIGFFIEKLSSRSWNSGTMTLCLDWSFLAKWISLCSDTSECWNSCLSRDVRTSVSLDTSSSSSRRIPRCSQASWVT